MGPHTETDRVRQSLTDIDTGRDRLREKKNYREREREKERKRERERKSERERERARERERTEFSRVRFPKKVYYNCIGVDIFRIIFNTPRMIKLHYLIVLLLNLITVSN